jgi:hypothetical protein
MNRRRVILGSILFAGIAATAAWCVWPNSVTSKAERILAGVRSGQDSDSTGSSLKAVAFGDSPAIRRLVALGPQAIPTLRNALLEPNRDVRMCAAWALSHFDDPALAALLHGSLSEELQPLARGVAHHKRTADAIMAAVRDPDSQVRERAVSVLAAAHRQDSVAILASVLNDGKLGTPASWGLADIGTPEAVEALAAALSGPVERPAARALARLKDKRATPTLLKIWKEEGFSPRTLSLLAELQDERALDAYREAFVRHDWPSRLAAADALIAIRTRQLEQSATTEAAR